MSDSLTGNFERGVCLRLIVLAAFAVMFVGCAQPEADALRLGVAQAPVTLDPRYATDAVSERVVRLLYSRLVDFDANFRPVPALARWSVVTPTQYRFELDPERAPFHDGARLSATDIKATYDDIINVSRASPHRGSLHVIDHIEVIGPDSVEFYLKRPDRLFPGRLVIGILPAALLARGHDFKRSPVGNGAFEFVEWPNDNRVLLRRRHDGMLVEISAVANATVRILKLLRGELDIVQGDLPSELVSWLQTQSGIRLLQARGTTFTYLGFNLDDPDAGRLHVREAIALALDRQAIVDKLLGGMARIGSSVLPPEHWAGRPAANERTRSLAGAREHLRLAGFDAQRPLRLVYQTSSNTFRRRLATVIQSQLQDAGIDIEIQSHDWGTFYGDVKAGRFQMYSLSWVGLKMPDIFRYAFHSTSMPPQGANRGRYRNARVDQLIETAERARDQDEQARLYRAVQAAVLEDLVLVPLWYEDQIAALREGVSGYVLASDGSYDGLANVSQFQ